MKCRYFVFPAKQHLRPYCFVNGQMYMFALDRVWKENPHENVESLFDSWPTLYEVDAKYMKLHYETKS